MHQDGREGVTQPLFRLRRDALRRLLYKTGLFRTRILVDFLGIGVENGLPAVRLAGLRSVGGFVFEIHDRKEHLPAHTGMHVQANKANSSVLPTQTARDITVARCRASWP